MKWKILKKEIIHKYNKLDHSLIQTRIKLDRVVTMIVNMKRNPELRDEIYGDQSDDDSD